MPRRRALLIGIEEYEHLTRVDYARADVTALRDRLIEVCSYLPEDIVVMTDEMRGERRPSNDRIISALDRLRNISDPDDSFLFFFAGHGTVRKGKSYLAALNANDESEYTLQLTSVPLETLEEMIQSMPARQKILLTDACRKEVTGRASGTAVMDSAFSRGFRDIVLKPGREAGNGSVGMILACDEGECAYPWPEKGHGVFCHFLLEALSERSADEQGRILFPRVQERIQHGLWEWSRERPGQRQTPCVQVKGDLAFGELPESKRKRPVQRPTLVVEELPATLVLNTEIAGELWVDEESMGAVRAGQRLRLKDLAPGPHKLAVTGTESFHWSGELAAGQVLELIARKPVAPPVAAPEPVKVEPPAPPPSEQHGEKRQTGAFFGIAGVAGVLVLVLVWLIFHAGRDPNRQDPQTVAPPQSDGAPASTAASAPPETSAPAATPAAKASAPAAEAVGIGKHPPAPEPPLASAEIWNVDDTLPGLGTWSMATAAAIQPTAVWDAGQGWLRSTAISPDGRWLATGADYTVKLWDLATQREAWQWKPDGLVTVFALAFTPDGRTVVAGTEDHGVKAWDAASGKQIWSTTWGNGLMIYDVTVSPDGQTVGASGSSGTVRVLDIRTGGVIRNFSGSADLSYSLAISRDGTKIASGGVGAALHVWDTATGKDLRSVAVKVKGGDPKNICNCSIAFNANGDKIISADYQRLRIFDARDGRLLDSIPGGFKLAAFPDGNGFVTKTNNDLRVYAGGRSWTLADGGDVYGLAVGSDHLIVSADYGGKVRVYKPQW